MSERDSICAPEEKPQVEYRDILGFPGYRVGSDGTVWSRWKRGFSCAYLGTEWKQLKPSPTGDSGYLVLTLCRDGKRFKRFVHLLVASAFLGPCPDGLECCHNSGIAADCAVANLRYDTPANNQKDRIAHGTDSRGEKCKTSVLTEEQVRYIRTNPDMLTNSALARMFGVTKQNVGLIIKRKSWAHLE
jgi:hypothetical protein